MNENLEYQLERLASLKAIGDISEEEYNQQKAAIAEQPQLPPTATSNSNNYLLIGLIFIAILLMWYIYSPAKRNLERASEKNSSPQTKSVTQ